MSLPHKAIDRLFERLAATYGSAWTNQWRDVPMGDVKTAWSHDLAGYTNNLQAVAWGLENLPERCPNAIEFRNLCRRAPAPVLPALPEAKMAPERVKQELAKLAPLRAAFAGTDHKDWARRIVARHEQGEKIRPYSLNLARSALKLNLLEGA